MTSSWTPGEVSDDLAASPEREVLTWERFGQAARELAEQVVTANYRPEVIIAIARGGMLPAGALAYVLGVKLADAINVEFYTDVAQTLPDPVLLAPMLDTESITGRPLLVVDDVVDTGRTMQLVLKLLRGFGAQVRSAVLYAKPSTVVRPDFVWATTSKWIVFPWSAQPTIEPTQAAQPTIEPTQAAQPTIEPTQAAQPTIQPTQAAQPTTEPTQAAQPTIEPTQAAQSHRPPGEAAPADCSQRTSAGAAVDP